MSANLPLTKVTIPLLCFADDLPAMQGKYSTSASTSLQPVEAMAIAHVGASPQDVPNCNFAHPYIETSKLQTLSRRFKTKPVIPLYGS